MTRRRRSAESRKRRRDGASVEVEGDGAHEVGTVSGGVGLLETGEDFGARVAVSVAKADRDYGIARMDGGEQVRGSRSAASVMRDF